MVQYGKWAVVRNNGNEDYIRTDEIADSESGARFLGQKADYYQIKNGETPDESRVTNILIVEVKE